MNMSKSSITQKERCPNCHYLSEVNMEELDLTNSKFTCTECGHIFDLKQKILHYRDKKLIDAMEAKLKVHKSTIKKA
jgi:Fe2+ or Zn2+ uptake regulation protein